MKRRPTSILTTLALSVLPPEKGAPPTLKRTDKTYKPIYMTAAMIMTVLLAVTVLLAQNNPPVVLTEEEFQALLALLAAGGDTPVGTLLTDEQFQVLTIFVAAEQGDPEAQFNLGAMYALAVRGRSAIF